MKSSWINSRRRLALLLSLVLTVAVLPCAVAQQQQPLFTDVQFIGGSGLDYVYEALPMPDGNLWVTCGTYGGFGDIPEVEKGSSLGLILCLSPDGNLLWQRTYGTLPGQNVVVRPALQADGTVAIWNHHSVAQVMDEVRVLILNESGEELARHERPMEWPFISVQGENFWITDYNNETYLLQSATGETLISIPFTQIGRYRISPVMQEDGMVFSSTEDDGIMLEKYGIADVSHTVIEKLSPTGGPMWKTDVKVEGRRCAMSLAMQTSAGELMAIGSVYDQLDDREKTATGGATVLAPDGRILWQKEYGLDGDSHGFTSAVEIDAGYVFLYTSKTDTYVNIILTDKQGNELGRGSFRADKEAYRSPELATAGGAVWLYGSAERKGSEDDIVIMRLNLDALLPKQ